MPNSAHLDPLRGQRAAVTGASSGIGAAVSVALSEAGASLVLIGRSAERLGATADTIKANGSQATVTVCDLTRSEDVLKLGRTLGPLDILVNNAGANRPGPLIDMDCETLSYLWALNVQAPVLLAQAVARSMITESRGGTIINISSQMGHVGAAGRTAYCTTKHAIEGFTKAAAVELASENIRVLSVAPTFVSTAMTKPFFANETFRDQTLAKIPLGRLATVDDVAAAVVFAASPAARMITGTSIIVDGGWTAQ